MKHFWGDKRVFPAMLSIATSGYLNSNNCYTLVIRITCDGGHILWSNFSPKISSFQTDIFQRLLAGKSAVERTQKVVANETNFPVIRNPAFSRICSL